ncbi:TIGR02302 family protein [Chelatococcus sp. SYSU_G07232]|uniref:TIGR02302 family protein n=1 Tax=Chelatococcus albus TaxID=3047466 RepID=A0ABT7AL60_9HYPH|nr:TIGR02302 family protein [Chelatococcus sp. SYSU_G07232]MDJ1159564.1 TIGR02302 family protein [Chelatococcus sp. SYSU_G07232]
MSNAPRPSDSLVRSADRTRLRLARLVRRARLALLWEALWRALWPPLGILVLFVAASWFGLWLATPPGWREGGVLFFGVALLASLIPLLRLARPARRDALARLDRDSGVAHRPASTLDDTLALGRDDSGTQALWELHRRRTRAAIDALHVAPPRPGMAMHDRRALRAFAIVALVGSAFVAGPEMGPRLLSAFDWRDGTAQGPAFRIDGWIDPPLYTRLPPQLIDLGASHGQTIRVRAPVRSTLVVRASGKADVTPVPSSGLRAFPPAAAAKPDLTESRFAVEGDARLILRSNAAPLPDLVIEAIPDRPPEVRLSGEPQVNARGSLTLAYRMKDDYGIASAEAQIESDQRAGRRSLVPPPRIPLTLPADPAADEDTHTTSDLSAHPWAGARVRLALVARDEAGQEGRSDTVTFTLPQRPFTKPLAKALVEQRRRLILAPDETRPVLAALDALMVAPDRFTPELGIYLGLILASSRLAKAKTDADLIDVAELLWTMAVQIEDGDLSESERELRAAQEALRQALERGASEDEIRKLTQDLRRALDNFLREFAERQMRENRDRPPDARADVPMRTITPNDLKNMLDRLEDLARLGATADAQRLLEELRNILENLQTARPGRPGDPMAREMNRSLEELDRMIRDQQTLRDDTFREGEESMSRRLNRNRQRADQGQPGERPRGQRQRGSRQDGGDQSQAEQGEMGDDGQDPARGLSQRQQALRERLEELKRRMKGLGLEGDPGLDDAEQAMRDAEGQLGQGNPGDAVDAQGRALDGLRRGAQGLAQQMLGDGDGTEQADGIDGRPGRATDRGRGGPRDEDPLGRPTRSRDWSDGRVKVPTAEESASVRARRILEELRRRLGEPMRPQEELDYLERLLRRN